VPRTISALAVAPIPRISGFSPMVMFSLLQPGTHITPHYGSTNTRLICHLPIIVPDGCAIRVGNETRSWTRGEGLIFDDSFQHEAWNRGSGTRVILLFEIWRPDISNAERDELTALFEAIELSSFEDAIAA
jgi:aspartyl/asparaginyl beta-hydroxylase (cupin superfamily)